MFSHTAQYYDTIYLAMKDDGAEADTLTTIIDLSLFQLGLRLLDYLLNEDCTIPVAFYVAIETLKSVR